MSNLQEGRQVRSCFSITSISDLPLNPVANQGLNQIVNKGMGSPLRHMKQIRPSQYVGNGSASISQLSDGSSKTLQAEQYNKAGRGCSHNTLRRAVLSGFGDEPDPNMFQYDQLSHYGLLGMPYCAAGSNGSLKLELPLFQSAESADSAGTPRSAITSPLMSYSLSNHMLSEGESFGSNASNFLEALMQV